MKTVKCEEWVKRDNEVIAPFSRIPYYPLVFKRGEGAMLEDVDGNQFIDLLSSASSQNLGYANAEITQAVKEQMDEYTQFTNAYMYSPRSVELAEKLVSITPGDFKKKVAFGLSGSDGMDGAIKIAKGYTGRNKLIVFEGAYHGSTFGALSLSNVAVNMRRGLGSVLPDIYSFPFPNTYRDGEGATQKCIDAMQYAFDHYLPPEEVAAIILEPIQGDGGLVVPTQAFMDAIAALCKKHGMLLISDEIQQGLMRTGKWFGIDQFNIAPDLLVMGKSLAGGLPQSAVVGRAEVMDALGSPAHLFSMGGNATCCAAALKMIEIMERPGFREGVNERGDHFKARLEALAQKHPCIGEVRGRGLSIGVELVKDRQTKEPDDNAAKKICYQGWQKGIILISLVGNVLRIQPPLVITREQIDKAVDIIDEAMTEYESGQIDDSVLELVKGWK